MIQVKQLEPSRRKHARVRSPLVVEAGAERLDVVDWSAGGLRVAAMPAALNSEREAPVRVSVPVEALWIGIDATVRVVRTEPDGEVALAFATLPGPGRELLHYLAQAERDGQPASVAGLLESVDLAPFATGAAQPAASPSPSPVPAAAGKPAAPEKGSRPPLRSFMYVGVGLMLAAYVADAAYRRVWRIEVETASLVAPTARIASPADGVVRELEVAPGEHVAAGDRLFLVESPAVQAALEDANLEVEQAEVRVAELEAAREAQEERLSIHGRMLRSRIASQRQQVALLSERVQLADQQVARLRDMLGRGIVSQVELEEVAARRAALAGQLEEAQSFLKVEKGRLGAARSGFYFDGDRIENGLPEVDAALATARAEVDLEKAQLAALVERAEAAQTGVAPFEGRVAQVLQTAGTPVRQGNLVVVLERDQERLVEAWLTRHQAEYVRLGDTARVEVPGLDREYDAVVRSIEADPTGSGLAAAGEDARMQVLLEMQGFAGDPESGEAALAELAQADSVGLPAVVSFPRSWR